MTGAPFYHKTWDAVSASIWIKASPFCGFIPTQNPLMCKSPVPNAALMNVWQNTAGFGRGYTVIPAEVPRVFMLTTIEIERPCVL